MEERVRRQHSSVMGETRPVESQRDNAPHSGCSGLVLDCQDLSHTTIYVNGISRILKYVVGAQKTETVNVLIGDGEASHSGRRTTIYYIGSSLTVVQRLLESKTGFAHGGRSQR